MFTIKYTDTNNNRRNYSDSYDNTFEAKQYLSLAVRKAYNYEDGRVDGAIIDECDEVLREIDNLTDEQLADGYRADYDGKYVQLTYTK